MVEPRDVVVIGGGFAGLAAGVALADRGFRVALLEGKPALGGRAYSFTDSQSGDIVDNGQHVLMGCYGETLDFLGRIGTRDRLFFHRNLEILMLERGGARSQLRTARLPGPFHMGAALLRYRLLTPTERLGVMMAGIRMMAMRRRDRMALEQLTVAAMLTALGQGVRARRCFWNPLAIATLNENPELASAALLAEVVARTMFSRRFDSAFGYAQVGLSDLYCAAAASFIERRGGVVASHALVDRIELDGQGAVARVRLRDGRALGAANFVAAVPPDKLLRMLPERVGEDPAFARLAGIGTSPIICVHLWLDREVIRAPFAGFIGTTTQWLFNKRRILQDGSLRRQGYLSFVISGARKLVDRPAAELIKLVIEDLHAVLPSARAAHVLNGLVVKEKQATIAPDPGSGRLRPPVETPLNNFFLAGDWVATGLPATIESAVIAGRKAAEAVVRRAGQAHGESSEAVALAGAA